jgi:hypothetical protein
MIADMENATDPLDWQGFFNDDPQRQCESNAIFKHITDHARGNLFGKISYIDTSGPPPMLWRSSVTNEFVIDSCLAYRNGTSFQARKMTKYGDTWVVLRHTGKPGCLLNQPIEPAGSECVAACVD